MREREEGIIEGRSISGMKRESLPLSSLKKRRRGPPSRQFSLIILRTLLLSIINIKLIREISLARLFISIVETRAITPNLTT